MTWIMELFKEIPLSSIITERLNLVEERYKLIQDKNAWLESENTRFKEDNARLRAEVDQLHILHPPKSFLDAHGVLWKESADKRIEPLPYCPKCKLALSKPARAELPGWPLLCSLCHFKAPFYQDDIDRIIAELSLTVVLK